MHSNINVIDVNKLHPSLFSAQFNESSTKYNENDIGNPQVIWIYRTALGI